VVNLTVYSPKQTMPVYLLQTLSQVYDIDMTSTDFFDECTTRFNEETAEEIGAVIMSAGAFEKSAKKAKRVNAKLESMAKEMITAFLLAIMSIHTFLMDNG